MFSWIHTAPVPEATWEEVTKLYIENYKFITVSEFDREIKPVVYGRNVPSIPIGGKGFGVDFTPITFLSCFYVQTKQGKQNS